MSRLELQVTGMDCGACERRIGTALGRLEGVGDVEADHRTGVVRVRLGTEEGDQAAVVERIEAAGFTVTATEQTGS